MTDSDHTLLADMAAARLNEDLADVTLLANDGTAVPASRFVLSMRSPVFARMLPFLDGRSAEVPVAYPGEVVGALVTFCHTDVVAIPPPDEVRDRTTVLLCLAANFFLIPLLEVKLARLVVRGWGGGGTRPEVIYPLYEELCLREAGGTASILAKAICETAQSLFRDLSYVLTNPGDTRWCGMEVMGPAVLGKLIKDAGARPVIAFRALRCWASIGEDGDELDRKQNYAKKFVQDVQLHKIDEMVLLGEVYESGLVEKDILLGTLRARREERAQLYPEVYRTKEEKYFMYG